MDSNTAAAIGIPNADEDEGESQSETEKCSDDANSGNETVVPTGLREVVQKKRKPRKLRTELNKRKSEDESKLFVVNKEVSCLILKG